jgi:hypothetical protein
METPLSTFELLVLTLPAIAICFIPFIRLVPQSFTTLVHEVGHALVGIPFGGFSQISIKTDTSAETLTDLGGVPGWLYPIVRFFHIMAGYPAPIHLGAAVLTLSLLGNSGIAAWVLLIVGVIPLLSTRSMFGLLVTAGFIALGCLAVFGFINPILLTVPMATILFTCGVKDIVELFPAIFGGYTSGDSDFHMAEDDLILPAWFWFILFLIGQIVFLAFFALVAVSYLFF